MRKTMGSRQGTRKKFSRKPRQKTTVNQFLRRFEEGDKVTVKVESSSHRALPHRRFLGNSGIVVGKRGEAYVVETRDGDKKKTLILTPEHLEPVGDGRSGNQ